MNNSITQKSGRIALGAAVLSIMLGINIAYAADTDTTNITCKDELACASIKCITTNIQAANLQCIQECSQTAEGKKTLNQCIAGCGQDFMTTFNRSCKVE